MHKHTLRGFTLVEVAVALTVATLFAAASIPSLMEDYNQTRTNLLVGEIQALSEAARVWAYDHEYSWPDQEHECKSAIKVLKDQHYLKAMDELSPWQSKYETNCSNPPELTITVASHPKWASIVANSLPATAPLRGDNTRTHVFFPGSIASLKQVMHRVHDYSHPELNQMETTLNMRPEGGDPQNIVGANRINAVNVTAEDENPKVQNTISAGNIVLADQHVKALNFVDSNSPDPSRPYYADPVGTTENMSQGISVLNATQSATQGQYGLTMLDPENNQNRAPKAYPGSLNANDLYLRSVHAPGEHNISNPWKWASHLDFVQCNWEGWSDCDGRLSIRFKIGPVTIKRTLRGRFISPRYYCASIPNAGYGMVVAATTDLCRVN